MRSHFVVIAAPGRDDRLGVLERREPVFVEAFVAELAVEALDVGVLGRLAGLDQQQLYAVGLRPLVQRSAGELRPLVGADRRRVAAESTGGLQQIRHALAVDAPGRFDDHGLLGAVVDHVQAFDRLAVGQRIEHEIHRPGVVRPGRNLQRPALVR